MRRVATTMAMQTKMEAGGMTDFIDLKFIK